LPSWLRDGLEKIKQEKQKKQEHSKPEPIPQPKPVRGIATYFNLKNQFFFIIFNFSDYTKCFCQ